jgi:SSS family solute:Na+ symporter
MFWSGILNAFFFGAAILLGLVARASLHQDVPGNHVLFELVRATLPAGLVGLAVVGAFAAFMSTANSMLTVSVNSILCDLIYLREDKLSRQPGILRLGRWLTWGVGAAGLLIAYLRPNIVSLILTGLWGSGVLIPAIVGGLYWKRATTAGAFWSILVGFMVTFALAYRTGWEDTSWIPGLGLGLALFVGISLLTGHTRGERLKPV